MNSASVKSTAFLITIDTEGDSMWSRPTEIRTENSRYLPRFQTLCEKYGLKPTWLTNYEMAQCPVYQEFASDVIARGTGEIGMHLHAWNNPPLTETVSADDLRRQPYLIEYSEKTIRDKVAYLTDLLEDRFGRKMLSHRAGRWALDERYCHALVDNGYRVDCSVTPHVSWASAAGGRAGSCGSDYRRFSHGPYWVDLNDIQNPGQSPLLELPMTIRRIHRGPLTGFCKKMLEAIPGKFSSRASRRLFPETQWLRPDGRSHSDMLVSLVQSGVAQECAYVEFMLHSSEFMPGGSPRFPDDAAIDRMFRQLEILFEYASSCCSAATLTEFYEFWCRENRPHVGMRAETS